MDEYECVARGKLKLKKDSEIKKKKKKKSKNKDKEKLMEKVMIEKPESDSNSNEPPVRQLTKAELSCKKMQEKMVSGRVRNIYIG